MFDLFPWWVFYFIQLVVPLHRRWVLPIRTNFYCFYAILGLIRSAFCAIIELRWALGVLGALIGRDLSCGTYIDRHHFLRRVWNWKFKIMHYISIIILMIVIIINVKETSIIIMMMDIIILIIVMIRKLANLCYINFI